MRTKTKLVRVRNLPPPTPNRKIQTPEGPATLLSRQPALYCPRCGATYSANPGDYWAADPDTVFRCERCKVLLRLGMKRETWDDVPLKGTVGTVRTPTVP